MPHRTAGGEIKSTYCAGLEHSEDEYWKKPRFGAANFLETLQDDEAAIATVKDKNPQQQPVAKLVEATYGIDVMMEDVLKMAGMTIGKELGPELGATNEELTGSAEERISTSLVEMTAVIENDTNIVSREPPVDRLELPEEQVSTKDEAVDLTPEEQPVEELMEEAEDANLQQDVGMDSEVAKNEEERSNREQSREESGGEVCVEQIEAAIQLGQVTFIDDINIRSKLEAEKEEPFTFVLPPSAVEDDPVNQITMVSCTDEQQSRLVYVLVEVSQQADPSSRTGYGMEIRGDDSRVEAVRMELPDSFVAPDDSSMVSVQVDSQASPKPYYVDSSMQSPKVTMGTVVGELEFVNRAASLSSNHSEQEAKVVVSENDQPLSNMEVGVLNMNSV
jgi:hypothetical protein